MVKRILVIDGPIQRADERQAGRQEGKSVDVAAASGIYEPAGAAGKLILAVDDERLSVGKVAVRGKRAVKFIAVSGCHGKRRGHSNTAWYHTKVGVFHIRPGKA